MVNYGARHDFLAQLHELLQPATYLEIGVQRGYSLALAGPRTLAIGVDPAHSIAAHIQAPNTIYRQTSDEFFAGPRAAQHAPYDFAFIDGMHLVENALCDFMGVERLSRPDGMTVAVFDDVLPYSADIAGREPLPGDWAGDVWKINAILQNHRPDLVRILVDVDPTGVLVVLGLEPASRVLAERYEHIARHWAVESRIGPGNTVLSRFEAMQPADALAMVRTHLHIPTEA